MGGKKAKVWERINWANPLVKEKALFWGPKGQTPRGGPKPPRERGTPKGPGNPKGNRQKERILQKSQNAGGPWSFKPNRNGTQSVGV